VSDTRLLERNRTNSPGYLSSDGQVGLIVLLSYVLFYILFFSPSLMNHELLAPGDGFIFYYPVVEKPFSLWSNLILCGYPTFADSQFLTWYPLKLVGLHFNGMVIAAYVMASFFAYGLCSRITGSHLAGALGGFVFGMSGFMTAHMGHLTIIHAAAWIPLVLWSLDHVTTRLTAGWWLIGAGAVAGSFLAGHPQIFVYGMLLAGGFAALRVGGAIRENPQMALRIGAACLGMVAMGFALAAIQIVPLIEISSSSVRQALSAQQGWTFQNFIAYSLPLDQLAIVLFPNLFGSFPPTGGGPLELMPYFGGWNLAEISCYFGVTTLLLALIAIGSWSGRRSETLFWTATALISAIFALGGATPLAQLAFRVPLLGKFGEPARSVMVLDLALAVLASMGLMALLEKQVRRSVLIGACVVFAGILSAALAGVYTTYPAIQKMFELRMGGTGYHLPAAAYNPAIYLPILLGIIALISVIVIMRGRLRLGCVLLFVAVAVDLGLFDYYGNGRNFTFDRSQIQMDSTWHTVTNDLLTHHARLLPLENSGAVVSPGTQIINILHGIPSAGGYGPLMQESYAGATGMTPSGYLALPPPNSPLFKILDVLWIYRDERLVETPLLVQMGRNCGPSANPEPRQIHLPTAIKATRLHIVSYLGCSVGIAQNEKVVEIRLSGVTGQTETTPLLAGRDTAEWAIDRADVGPATLHQRATIFSSFDAGGFSGHRYETTLSLGHGQPVDVQDIELDWLPMTGSIAASEITLIDDTAGVRYTVPANLEYPSGDDWDRPVRTSARNVLQRYRKALGLAWLVDETLPMARPDIAQAIATGHLPDQSVFDPGRTALIEGPLAAASAASTADEDRRVDVLEMLPERLALDVLSPKPAFLVISQLYYPGWGVRVNGHGETLYRTNYAFQGVTVPAGHSRVELTFRPQSLLYGAGITLLAALFGVYLVSLRLWDRRRAAGSHSSLLSARSFYRNES
jgi:Bacterial membrane protein YfhO